VELIKLVSKWHLFTAVFVKNLQWLFLVRTLAKHILFVILPALVFQLRKIAFFNVSERMFHYHIIAGAFYLMLVKHTGFSTTVNWFIEDRFAANALSSEVIFKITNLKDRLSSQL
jgi:hypothetical protein